MKRFVAGGAVIMACALAGAVLFYGWPGQAPNRLPAFRIADLSGEMHSPADWRGEILVMNFWATWCKPCREEIPMLIQAQKELADQGVQIVGLAVDRRKPVRRFVAKYDINYPVLVPMAATMRLQALLGGRGLPFTVIVDRQGYIRAKVAGRISRARLNALLAPLLREK